MPRAWFVTAATDPDTPLDGPFVERDECERRCLQRTDRMTVLRAFTDKRVPAYYVPHQFEVREMEVRHLYRDAAERAREMAKVPVRARVGPADAPLLPPVVHTYTRGDLLILCKSLELRAPPTSADKAGIISHIEKQLRTLSRGAARG